MHQAWMQQALSVAEQALPRDVPVGALLIKDGQVIAKACNRREVDRNPVAHAEMLVLQEAAAKLGDWRLTGTTLYVTLEPCPMCAAAIQQARVSKVVFGAYDPLAGACGSKHALLVDSPEVPVLGGILEEECSELLRSFFKERRNEPLREEEID
ncbi:MAG TPA: nucleoside deaminase [Coleofasciculaceae cyanobacterium]